MNNNIIYIGDENSGKTIKLLNIVDQYLNDDYSVIVIDSATDHNEKSLICKLKKIFPDIEIFDSLKIYNLPNDNYLSIFDIKSPTKLYLFDVSYFLGKSYGYNDPILRATEREKYKKEAEFILQATKKFGDSTLKVLVVMDEIEITDQIMSAILQLNKIGVFCLAALHPNVLDIKFQTFFEIKNCIGLF
jgi:GTPase SAR1 family protein